MSENETPSKPLGPSIQKPLKHHNNMLEHPVYGAPGCGLASYSCLLLLFFVVGIGGLIVSSMALLQGQNTDISYYVRQGNQVQTRRLQPMRDAKVIQLLDIPILYHDESTNGTVACALMEKDIVRVDESESWKIPYDQLIDAISEPDGYGTIIRAITKNQEQLPCYFEQSEGHGLFLKELKSQIQRANSTEVNQTSGE